MSFLQVSGVAIERAEWRAEYDFSLAHGTWLSIIGPSGGGKTTLLELLAGFQEPTRGTMSLGGERLNGLPPARRNLGYVFQRSALFPHLSIEGNLRLALHDSRMPRTERNSRVREVLDLVRLPESFLRRYPAEVSGGELARLNVARALLRPARLLLLDEPFAALDETLRLEMNALVRRLHDERGLTTLCVTHHQEDALLFSDQVLVIADGRTAALATPAVLVREPPSPFVADFLRAGTLFHKDGEQYYLRAEDLTTDRGQAARFSNPIEIVVPRFRASSAGTHLNIIDLDSFAVFRLRNETDFSGWMCFDGATALRFSRR